MNLRSRFLMLAILALAAGLMTATARADVTYTFSGTNDGIGGDNASVSFQYTSASFVNSFTSLFKSQLNSCTNCSGSGQIVFFAPNTFVGDGLGFYDAAGGFGAYVFNLGAFSSPGTYHSGGLFSTGTLTVSTVAVPEPATLLLAMISFAVLGFAMLIRRRQTLQLAGN
jgi:hypothetical protein